MDGSTEAVEAAAERLRNAVAEADLEIGMAPGQVNLLGPVEVEGQRPGAPQQRLVIRAEPALAARLVPMLRHLRSAHSMRGEGGPLRVRVNPIGQL